MGVAMPIVNADVIEWMRSQKTGTFDLAFADPPFNIGQKYHGFTDKRLDFIDWCEEWIDLAWSMIRPGGVLVLHGSSEVATHQFTGAIMNTATLDAIEREVCWYFGFCQNTDKNWPDAFCRAYVLRKPGTPKNWFADGNLVESERLKMGDKRVRKAKRKGMIVPNNVWQGEGLCRVQGNNSERWDVAHGALVDHPNQLPQLYCARFVKAYTKPDDRVLDLFCGSGTMPLVCRRLRRDCSSLELVEQTAKSARRRLRHGFVSKGW